MWLSQHQILLYLNPGAGRWIFFLVCRTSNFGAWSYLDPWCQWEPSVPPGRGQWAAGAHHRWGEECGTNQPLHQEWCGSLPDQLWEEDTQGPGGGVQWPVQWGEGDVICAHWHAHVNYICTHTWKYAWAQRMHNTTVCMPCYVTNCWSKVTPNVNRPLYLLAVKTLGLMRLWLIRLDLPFLKL